MCVCVGLPESRDSEADSELTLTDTDTESVSAAPPLHPPPPLFPLPPFPHLFPFLLIPPPLSFLLTLHGVLLLFFFLFFFSFVSSRCCIKHLSCVALCWSVLLQQLMFSQIDSISNGVNELLLRLLMRVESEERFISKFNL